MDIDIRFVPREQAGIGVGGEFDRVVAVRNVLGELLSDQRIGKLPNQIMERINKVIEDFIVTTTKQGVDADGNRFEDLTDKYKKQKSSWGSGSMADLYARRDPAHVALDDFHIKRDGQSNRMVGEFKTDKQLTYMSAHQTGELPQPRRKFFPDEDSFSSAHYQNVVREVEEIIHEYLMERMARLGG